MKQALGEVLATVNACLNATALLLLVAGFVLIKSGRIDAHRRCMQLAVVTSAVFLASYLTRYALTGSHKFVGVGPLRAVYFAILLTHMALAVATVPLALRTLFLARSERFAEHRRAARLTFPIWAYVSVTGVAVYVLLYHVDARPEPALRIELPAFELVDHRARRVTRDDMRGKVWIADFIFTACTTVCPRLSARMAEIEKRTSDLGGELQLVSFSVDPETDTPERLAQYAASYQAGPRWTFVTGSLGAVEETVVAGFKIAMGKDELPGGLFAVFHGERFVLVDRSGAIRGYYEADDAGVERIVADARRLAR